MFLPHTQKKIIKEDYEQKKKERKTRKIRLESKMSECFSQVKWVSLCETSATSACLCY